MKAVSESTWTFQMIIIFMLIFAAFLALVLMYSKAFSVKNQLLTVVEKYESFSTEALAVANNYAKQKSYQTTASCPNDEDGWYGVEDLNEPMAIKIDDSNANNKYYYCFIKRASSDDSNYVYFEVQVFYKFNLPFVGEVGLYRIKGKTKKIMGYEDGYTLGVVA